MLVSGLHCTHTSPRVPSWETIAQAVLSVGRISPWCAKQENKVTVSLEPKMVTGDVCLPLIIFFLLFWT